MFSLKQESSVEYEIGLRVCLLVPGRKGMRRLLVMPEKSLGLPEDCPHRSHARQAAALCLAHIPEKSMLPQELVKPFNFLFLLGQK